MDLYLLHRKPFMEQSSHKWQDSLAQVICNHGCSWEEIVCVWWSKQQQWLAEWPPLLGYRWVQNAAAILLICVPSLQGSRARLLLAMYFYCKYSVYVCPLVCRGMPCRDLRVRSPAPHCACCTRLCVCGILSVIVVSYIKRWWKPLNLWSSWAKKKMCQVSLLGPDFWGD